MTVVNQSRFEALVRRHFSFARIGDQPTISRTGNEWRAAFAVGSGWTEERLEAAFAEQADGLRRRLE
jgi:hypothetical protein